jgi:hypothetical protein
LKGLSDELYKKYFNFRVITTAMMDSIEKYQNQLDDGYDSDWEAIVPTAEDIKAAYSDWEAPAYKVENPAIKGSVEDKLLTAVENCNLKNVEAFIAAGADLEARDEKGLTALMLAAKKGYADIVSALVKAGALVTLGDGYGATALFYAAKGGHVEVVKILLAHGAAKGEENFKELFVSAVFKGNNEMVKALMIEDLPLDYYDLELAYSFAITRCSAEVARAIQTLRNAKVNR